MKYNKKSKQKNKSKIRKYKSKGGNINKSKKCIEAAFININLVI